MVTAYLKVWVARTALNYLTEIIATVNTKMIKAIHYYLDLDRVSLECTPPL